ncbi:unnamed protein product [Tilletia controversa]|uniref:Uncharacterized protein n=2 Tax=Tilletia TaxID=13289 RepID=A0A9N8QE36_9BASI|nr:unnamed protein product [Tilletia caries]CAD6910422.1 unnamed protein product [Tilletia controversa]CAD6933825.1 unnamed protein product [Tilletia laevis]CAD6913756.1 unnamed protein product [Tilletia caries]CAD6951738.1 unnamed protein product [Tilletia controversa]
MTAISSPSSTHDIVKRAIMDDIDRVLVQSLPALVASIHKARSDPPYDPSISPVTSPDVPPLAASSWPTTSAASQVLPHPTAPVASPPALFSTSASTSVLETKSTSSEVPRPTHTSTSFSSSSSLISAPRVYIALSSTASDIATLDQAHTASPTFSHPDFVASSATPVAAPPLPPPCKPTSVPTSVLPHATPSPKVTSTPVSTSVLATATLSSTSSTCHSSPTSSIVRPLLRNQDVEDIVATCLRRTQRQQPDPALISPSPLTSVASPSLPAHAAVSAVISTSFSSSGSSSNTTAPASPVNASSSPQALLATVKPACSVAPTPYGALLSNLRARQPVPATKASTSMRVDLDASSSHSSRHISPLQRSSGPLEDATKVLSRKTFGRATAVGDNDAAFTLPSGAAVEMRSGTMMVSKHAVPITVNTRCRSEEAGHGDAIAPSNDTSIASPAAPSLADEEETSRPRGSPSMFREVRAFEKTGTRPSHHTHLSGKANSAQIAVSRVRNAWLDARRVVLDAGLTTSALVLKFFFGPSTPSLLLCLHSRITSSTSRPI